MALKKSELYSSLWSSCDELRGGMDASQYKDYVLVGVLELKNSRVSIGEPTHDARFIALMDGFLPQWRGCREALNQLPVPHERWGY
jgi:hypothetical protein